MIPYDELCQALERWAALRRNEAEMQALEGGGGYAAEHAVSAEGVHEAYADDDEGVIDADVLAIDSDDVYDEAPRSAEVDVDERAMADPLTQQPTELVPADDGIGEVPTIVASDHDAQRDPTASGYEVNLQAASDHNDIKREGEA